MNDFVIISEFGEKLGPNMVDIYPHSTKFDLDNFVLRVMSVDPMKRTSLSNSQVYDVLMNIHDRCLHVDSYVNKRDERIRIQYISLIDFYARGFIRPIALCYVTHSHHKSMSLYHDLSLDFSSLSTLLKDSARRVFIEDTSKLFKHLHNAQEILQQGLQLPLDHIIYTLYRIEEEQISLDIIESMINDLSEIRKRILTDDNFEIKREDPSSPTSASSPKTESSPPFYSLSRPNLLETRSIKSSYFSLSHILRVLCQDVYNDVLEKLHVIYDKYHYSLISRLIYAYNPLSSLNSLSIGHLRIQYSSSNKTIPSSQESSSLPYLSTQRSLVLYNIINHHYSHIFIHLLYSFLIGRCVIIIGDPIESEYIANLIQTFRIFILQPSFPKQSNIIPWAEKPIRIHELSYLRIVGYNYHLHLSSLYYSQCSILHRFNSTFTGPHYQGTLLNKFMKDLLNMPPYLLESYIHIFLLKLSKLSIEYYYSLLNCQNSMSVSLNPFLASLSSCDLQIIKYFSNVMIEQHSNNLLSQQFPQYSGLNFQLTIPSTSHTTPL